MPLKYYAAQRFAFSFVRNFISTRIEWAKLQPTVEKIIVSHRASNASSKYANQKHGFVMTHKTGEVWTDGATEDEIFYELKINS